jgi:hypothetical protein
MLSMVSKNFTALTTFLENLDETREVLNGIFDLIMR